MRPARCVVIALFIPYQTTTLVHFCPSGSCASTDREMQPSWTLDLGEVYDVSSLVVYVNLGIDGKILYIFLNIFQRLYNFTDIGIFHLSEPGFSIGYRNFLRCTKQKNKRTNLERTRTFLNTVWRLQSMVVTDSHLLWEYFIACTRTCLRIALMVGLWSFVVLLKQLITYRSGYWLGQVLSDDIIHVTPFDKHATLNLWPCITLRGRCFCFSK